MTNSNSNNHISINSKKNEPSNTSNNINDNNKNVGILAMEVYTPSTYIKQSALEEHSGVAAGKYTIGLGQEGLSVVMGDVEDINSLCLTVVHNLLEKYQIDPMTVGRLEVGTETLVDKSKSTKTVLMDLFPGNTDIEGATIINACYGGTAALLNAFMWCESDGWDGRYAIVVAADIAAYARGPARPTSGAGAVAILVGRDAPLAFNAKYRATHASNVWDFYKPDHTVEYPTVDGALSQVCYYQALEDVYNLLVNRINQNESGQNEFDAESADYFVFHSPYNKLVQKSYARLFLCDARRRYQKIAEQSKNRINDNDENDGEEKKEVSDDMFEQEMVYRRQNEIDITLEPWLSKPIEETYDDKALESTLKKLSDLSFKQRLTDANRASQLVGNTYTASVFLGLASLIDRCAGKELTDGKRIIMFSYGSGAIASMYQLRVRQPTSPKFTVERMSETMQLSKQLDMREVVHPSELDHAMETRARMHRRVGAMYSPVYPTVGRLFPGTYYLTSVDSQWRRTYARVPLTAKMITELSPDDSVTLAPPSVLKLHHHDQVSHPVTGKLLVLDISRTKSDSILDSSIVEEEARSRIACVITGTAAALPCGKDPFAKDNMDRLIAGDQFICPISDSIKKAMLDKNVIQIKKLKDGTVKRFPVNTEDSVIQLAAQLGSYDLTSHYGVVEGLAQTMDTAAQIAVAAGMEALRNAGLVRGASNDPSEWMLPEMYRDSTGVVYASSFPALDAAIGEVMRFLRSKTVHAADTEQLIAKIRSRLLRSGKLSEEDEVVLQRLIRRCKDSVDTDDSETDAEYPDKYEFDRKFLFKLLVLGNAQLAQLTGCRGPNTQTNAACAGTTQAIAMAQDMLISGRAERVVVIAGDNASSATLLPWIGSGFRALGAACTKSSVEEAALPFDARRSGMLLGAGGIGMVLETEESCIKRMRISSLSSSLPSFEIKARLLATQYSNSAYHGAALDRDHIGRELQRFLNDVEFVHGISKSEIAHHGVYFSHETCTHASAASSCSGNEVAALRFAFGEDLLSKLLLVNTKGFTGHPMGVSFEDVTAVEVLMRQTVPPVPNYKVVDDYLGRLNISKGGPYPCRYALRFAAGFGSQVAFALYATAE